MSEASTAATEGGRIARAVLIAGIAVWVVSALVHWWLAVPLGHDEARYALDARDILEGRPSRFIYAGGGMTAIAIPGVLAGATERGLRLLPMLLGGGFLASAWYAARATLGSTTAAWTVGVLAGGRGLALFGTELLSDLPSAACMLCAIGLLASELSRPSGPRWRLVWAAALFDASYYIRYGSCIPIAVIVLVFLWVARANGCLRARPVLGTVAAAAVGLLPHLVWSIHITGSPLGVLRASSQVPPAPTGYLGYLHSPFASYGLLVAPLAVVGLLAIRRRRQVLTLYVIALAQLVILTLTTEAQARYAFLATALLVMLGVDFVLQIVRSSRGRARTMAAALSVALLVASWATVMRDVARYRPLRARGAASVLAAARVISADRDPRLPCEVTSSDLTRIEWYSGCAGVFMFEQSGRQYLVHLGRETMTSPEEGKHLAYERGVVDVIRLR